MIGPRREWDVKHYCTITFVFLPVYTKEFFAGSVVCISVNVVPAF